MGSLFQICFGVKQHKIGQGALVMKILLPLIMYLSPFFKLLRLQSPANGHYFRFFGSFVKLQNFRIAIPFLNGIFFNVTVTAVQFNCIIGAKYCCLLTSTVWA